MNSFVVAIDGGVGTGKTTVAREIAKRIDAKFLSTGRLYRAIAYNCTLQQTDITKEEELKKLLEKTSIEVKFKNDNQITILNSMDVSDMLSSPQIDYIASEIAKKQFIRDYVIKIQRDNMKKYTLVLEGRDIGTVVAPDAKFKFFFTASTEVKAKRRMEEWVKQGKNILNKEDLIEEIKQRDEKDEHRSLSPLYMAPDAILIDTSDKTIDEVAEYICKIIRRGNR